MRKVLALAAIALLTFSLCWQPCARVSAQATSAQAPDKYAEKLRAFEEFAQKEMERDKIPGLTIGFMKDDYSWTKGFGFADLENKVPATAQSAYRLASVTKMMTGTAIVQLAERGKLNLDGEIQTYVPYYPKQKWPVTVRQLLVHLGGGQVGSGLSKEPLTTREVVARIARYPIELEPGTKFDYQTSGYNLLGAAIEEVSGKPFGDYLRENLFVPLGMNDTRLDSVRDLIPNRVRGYELANGQVRNAEFIDTSSRFGGGGLTGTVPDLLRWGRGVVDGKVLSKASLDEMFTPVTTKGGRYNGIGDGDWYYALGWLVLPINGHFVVNNSGSQKGTATEMFHFPSQNLTIAFAANLEFANTRKYIKHLYELLTDEAWDINVYAADKLDQPIYKGMSSAFNYGAMNYDKRGQPTTTDAQELANAFAFFNRNVSREALRADYEKTAQQINDGRHPVAGIPFIKIGSYMALRLRGKYGPERFKAYHLAGAIPFFADYIAMYRADPKYPKTLRFNESFEKLVQKWNADWSRTWNDYTRHLIITPSSDLDAIATRLKKDFAGAEIYPDYTSDIQPIQNGAVAWKAGKLGIDLYPRSDELNFNWGFFLLVAGDTEQGRAVIKEAGSDANPPLFYFRRAAQTNPNGVAAAKTFTSITRNWINRPEMLSKGIEMLRAAADLHPSDASVYELLGDFLLRKGEKEQAVESYKKALELDPKLSKGVTTETFIANKMQTLSPPANGSPK
jgi:CubicO group peptidase (beta-lactamase class C family)